MIHELALFAGAGGGILGGMLAGFKTVCVVEIDDYCRRVLLARQSDGVLPIFPIWDDVRTFDGRPWRGEIDAVKREVLDYLFPEGEALDCVNRHDDRRVPNAASRALKEKLERAICLVDPPEGTEVTVGRIKSVEIYVPCECQGEAYCDKCDDDLEVKVKRTAVPVYVQAPHCDAIRWYLVPE